MMLRLLRAFSFVFVESLILGSVSGAAVVPTRYTMASVTNARAEASDPGPAPAFNRADYPSNLRSGSDTLAGSPAISLQTGRTIPCGIVSGAFVFPDTPYARWVIRTWLFRMVSSGAYSRPADGLSIAGPMDPYSKTSIVRGADCENGAFVIHDLPMGTYIVLADVSPTYEAKYYAPTVVPVPEVDGDTHLAMGGSMASTTGVDTDIFFLVANVRYDRPNETSVIPSSSWTGVRAHVLRLASRSGLSEEESLEIDAVTRRTRCLAAYRSRRTS